MKTRVCLKYFVNDCGFNLQPHQEKHKQKTSKIFSKILHHGAEKNDSIKHNFLIRLLLETGQKLNKHKTFRRRPRHLLE